MRAGWFVGTFVLGLVGSSMAAAEPRQAAPADEGGLRRHVLGSSLFMVANLLPMGEDAPSFYQLNYGYRVTPRDVLLVEAITWRYHAPLGIPYWASSDDSDRAYPGYVREYGVGLAYQRFLWRELYAGLHVTPFLRRYLDEAQREIQTGFQLFVTLRFGYHLAFFDDRVFVEPSVAFTYWPIQTNVPAAFARQDRKWPSYFLFEPGLHFGVRI